MAAEQVVGTPAPVDAPAAPAVSDTPAPEAEGKSYAELREEARKILFEAGGEEEEQPADPEKPAEPKPAPTEPALPEQPAAEFSVEGYRTKILDVLKELSPEQRDHVLGTTDDAFAALVAKNRVSRNRELASQQKETELAERESELTRLKGAFDEHLVKGKQNPVEALSLFGWTLDDANNFFLNGEKPDPARRVQELEGSLDERVEKLFKEKYEPKLTELEQAKKSLELRETQMNHMAWHQGVRNELAQVSKAEFPLVSRFPQDEIFDTVTRLQQHSMVTAKKPLATKQALMHIEERLRLQKKYLGGGEVERVDNKTPEAEQNKSGTGSNGASTAPTDEEEYDFRRRKKAALAALRSDD